MAGSAESDGGDANTDGRKGYGKRELSTSKRAAQNRAAQVRLLSTVRAGDEIVLIRLTKQRAFRQRKEGYIKKLEEQVREFAMLHENFKALQAENYQLRDYIISLQSRLLESQGEYPPPPANVEGLQPGKATQLHQGPLPPRLPTPTQTGQPSDGLSSLLDYPAAKRAKIGQSDMNPSQAALQAASILTHPPPPTR